MMRHENYDHSAPAERFAVVLAGGDGTRLRSLTTTLFGDDRPKQFCPMLNGSTLLEATRTRVARVVPPARTFFSLTRKHERYFGESLRALPKELLAVQPENKGTAPAILFTLIRIASANPNATVAFFPSDHYFSNDNGFMTNVERAFTAAEHSPDAVVLLGLEPENAETSYGWIEPADSLFGELQGSVARVERFWEKPAKEEANALMIKGCLWNSFVMVGNVQAFIEMYRRTLPGMLRMFETLMSPAGERSETAILRSVYAWINETNFSSMVLERLPEMLLVMRVSNVGWSDLGEPERVLGTLKDLRTTLDIATPVAA